jgi:hypothetical protein
MRNKPTAQSKQRRPKRTAAPPETERSELRRLVANMQAAREEEYLRIIHAVHDELLSRLVRTSLDLGELRRQSHGRARAWQFTWMGGGPAIQRGHPNRRRRAFTTEATIAGALRAGSGDGLDCVGMDQAARAALQGCRINRLVAVDSGNRAKLFRLFDDGVRSLTENCQPACLRIEIATGGSMFCLVLHSRTLTVNARPKLLSSPTFFAVRERARRLGGKLVVRDTSLSGISLALTVPAGS